MVVRPDCAGAYDSVRNCLSVGTARFKLVAPQRTRFVGDGRQWLIERAGRGTCGAHGSLFVRRDTPSPRSPRARCSGGAPRAASCRPAFEKASGFARFGQMLAAVQIRYARAALAALVRFDRRGRDLVARRQLPRGRGCERLSPQPRVLRGLTAARALWTWITGNQDIGLIDRVCGARSSPRGAGRRLGAAHEAEPGRRGRAVGPLPTPKLRVRVRGGSVSRRCLVATRPRLICRRSRADRRARYAIPRSSVRRP